MDQFLDIVNALSASNQNDAEKLKECSKKFQI